MDGLFYLDDLLRVFRSAFCQHTQQIASCRTQRMINLPDMDSTTYEKCIGYRDSLPARYHLRTRETRPSDFSGYTCKDLR